MPKAWCTKASGSQAFHCPLCCHLPPLIQTCGSAPAQPPERLSQFHSKISQYSPQSPLLKAQVTHFGLQEASFSSSHLRGDCSLPWARGWMKSVGISASPTRRGATPHSVSQAPAKNQQKANLQEYLWKENKTKQKICLNI